MAEQDRAKLVSPPVVVVHCPVIQIFATSIGMGIHSFRDWKAICPDVLSDISTSVTMLMKPATYGSPVKRRWIEGFLVASRVWRGIEKLLWNQ